jgi:hypothetical protein
MQQLTLLQFVQIEALISSVTDAYPKLRKHKQCVTALSCFIMFLGSLFCVTNVSTRNHFALLCYLSVLNCDVTLQNWMQIFGSIGSLWCIKYNFK